MDRRDLTVGIVQQLRDINTESGLFVAGILQGDIDREDQLAFALRLVRLAAHIQQRADGMAGMVIEGGVVDDGSSRRPALTAGTDKRADPPRPAADD
ncbi:hypothetical protein [Streptomyces sp. NPDC059631]|uniref:hypothetical protein n=1 Tax=unclassified Streptomyces TaxID=2593676 RepID=UPI0036C74B45